MDAQLGFAEELQFEDLDDASTPAAWKERVSEDAQPSLPLSFFLLIQRLALASIFFLSGRMKVEGWFSFSDTTFDLFEFECSGVPLPSEFAAIATTISEHVFPILLVLGLFTRFSALALLAMTATIQIFVYPDAWPTHLSWLALSLPLIACGGGRFSLDRAVAQL